MRFPSTSKRESGDSGRNGRMGCWAAARTLALYGALLLVFPANAVVVTRKDDTCGWCRAPVHPQATHCSVCNNPRTLEIGYLPQGEGLTRSIRKDSFDDKMFEPEDLNCKAKTIMDHDESMESADQFIEGQSGQQFDMNVQPADIDPQQMFQDSVQQQMVQDSVQQQMFEDSMFQDSVQPQMVQPPMTIVPLDSDDDCPPMIQPSIGGLQMPTPIDFMPKVPVQLGKKRHACECGLKFGKKSILTTHINTVHNGEKKHVCECGQKFGQKAHLTTHINTVHNGEKKHVCECGKAFGKKGNLARHIKEVHNA